MNLAEGLKPYSLPLLAGLFLFLSLFRLGSVTLFDVDEAVFSEATKEMVRTGDWITPTYNGANRYDKPIFFYWAMAASYKVFGINEFGARFPSALAGFLLCISIYLFVRRSLDAAHARYAALSFALSLYYLMYSHAAVTDMTLSLFIALSLFCLFLGVQPEDSSSASRYWIYGFYSFSALAFLTKGLIGILFPFGIGAIYLLMREGVSGVRRMVSFGGIALFILVSGPWYTAETIANGREFIEQFFIKHHFKRYTDTISGHRGPIYYYLPVLLIGLFPWIGFLPAGVARIFRSGGDSGKGVKQESKSPAGSGSLPLFAGIWLACIFVFFSVSTTKLPNYILPAVPAASILAACGMAERDKFWVRVSNGSIAFLALLLGIAFILSGKYLLRAGIENTSWTLFPACILLALAVLTLVGSARRKIFFPALAFLMLFFLVSLTVKALPLADEQLQGTLHKFSLYAKKRLNDNERIIAYRINNPSVVFYSDRVVLNAGNRDELASLAKGDKKFLVIAKTKDAESLNDMGLTIVDKGRKYALLEKN